MKHTVYQGDSLAVLKKLPEKSVNCVITSPPYWALRNYMTNPVIWGADNDCKHEFDIEGDIKDKLNKKDYKNGWKRPSRDNYKEVGNKTKCPICKQNFKGKLNQKFCSTKCLNTLSNDERQNFKVKKDFCKKCNAWRGELGLEPDFELYIQHLCDIFDEVKRVLRDDGVIFVNIGDTYYTKSGSNFLNDNISNTKSIKNKGIDKANKLRGRLHKYMQSKSLVGIPFRFAIEMINRGWILRNTIIWHKNNTMPSSAKDRFTVDFEYIFFFSKKKKYYFERHIEKYAENTDVWYKKELKENKNYNIKKLYKKNTSYAKSKAQNPSDSKRRILESMKTSEGRNKRTVWNINTKPFREAHFACVDEETEILTLEGWKKYNELNWKQHKKVATYNLDKKVIEYQPLSYVKIYSNCDELIKIGNRDLDILTTLNHRNIVKKRNGKEKIVLSKNLAYNDKIRVKAEMDYPENHGIGKYFAELIGWIISEGHYKITKYKDMNYKAIEIYQNKGNNERRIDFLLKRLQIPNTKSIRRKNQCIWYLPKSPLRDWCLDNIKDKKLNQFLVSLPKEEAKYLFNGLMRGDGHIRKDDGRISFIQKSKKTRDWFQILALRLGYHSIAGKDIYLTKRNFIGIKGTNGKGKSIKRVEYKGIVWCPKTPNGTWVARRNGRIFITGNTFPPELVETPIKAGCPRYVCNKCEKPREKIYKHNKTTKNISAVAYPDVITNKYEQREKQPYSIRKRKGWVSFRNLPSHEELRKYLQKWRKKCGKTIKEIEEKFGTQAPHHWFEKNGSYPSKEEWLKLKHIMGFNNKYDEVMTKEYFKPAEKMNYNYKFDKYDDCGCNVGFKAGVVLDPFVGSGTTAVACKKLGRKYIGIEISGEYCKIAEKRINNIPEKLEKWFE